MVEEDEENEKEREDKEVEDCTFLLERSDFLDMFFIFL